MRIEHYPHGFADWLVRTDCDAWLYTGGLENHPELVGRMSATRLLLGNSGEDLRRVRDPLVLQHELSKAGILFPETLESFEVLPLFSRWLCKTYRGAGGSGIKRYADHVLSKRDSDERVYFQSYIEGLPASAVFACHSSGSVLLGATRQLLGGLVTSPWRYSGSVGPLIVNSTVQSQLVAVGELLAKRFHLRGLVGVDFVIADDEAVVIEVNPRYTASVEVIERMTGVSAVGMHVAVCSEESSGILQAPIMAGDRDAGALRHGKVILYAKRDAMITPDFHAWAMERASSGHERMLADVPSAGECVAAGRPVLTALVSAGTAEYDQTMDRFLAEIESKLYPSEATRSLR